MLAAAESAEAHEGELFVGTQLVGLLASRKKKLLGRVAHIVTGTAFGSPSAVADARAIYGGMALGVASCFLLAARGDREAQRVGLIGSAVTYGFIAMARLLGIIVDGAGSTIMFVLLASELFGVMLSALAMRSLSRTTAANRGDETA